MASPDEVFRARRVRSLFTQVESGISFARMAQTSTGSMQDKALDFAKRAHADVLRLMGTAPLTNDEREQLTGELQVLEAAIDSFRRP